ncbi:hypothetical protein ACOMHN_016840 [Nucella lapillus]
MSNQFRFPPGDSSESPIQTSTYGEDKEKDEMEERRRALEAARNQVLDCPLCGKRLRTAQGRKSHLKKCASTFGVEPDRLLAAVKRQEKEHLATLAAGILPSREDNYLLLKLSEDQAAGRIEARASELITMEADDEEAVVPPLPHLQRRSLHGQMAQWSADDSTPHCKMLWPLSSLAADGAEGEGGPGADTDPLRYYVPSLMPPLQVSSAVAGSKVPRMSQVPGRRRSLQKTELLPGEEEGDTADGPTDGDLPPFSTQTAPLLADMAAEADGDLPPFSTQTAALLADMAAEADGDLPPFSTQTAALLADMAAEAEGGDPSVQLSPSSSQISAEVERRVCRDLLRALSSLVNQRQFSDVTIRTAGSGTLSAHRLILSARCPALLQLMDEDSRVIDLCEKSSQCVLAVLQFLYAGQTPTSQDCLPDILQLADRCGLTSLVQICRGQLDTVAGSEVTRSSGEGSEPLSQREYFKGGRERTLTKPESAATGHGDRKTTGASPAEEQDDLRQAGPCVLEGKTQIELPQDTKCGQNVSPRKCRLLDSKQWGHSQSPSPAKVTQRQEAKDFLPKSESGILVAQDQQIGRFTKVLQSESKLEGNLMKTFPKVADKTGKKSAVVTDTCTASCRFSAEIQPLDTGGEKCGTADLGGEGAKEVSCTTSGLDEPAPAFTNGQPPKVSFAGGVKDCIPIQNKKGNEHQPNSGNDDDEIQANKAKAEHSQEKKSQVSEESEIINPQQSCSEKTEKKNSPASRYTRVGLSAQYVEAVEWMEVSDEDLFSGDDMDVWLISSDPHNATETGEGRDKGQDVSFSGTDRQQRSASADSEPSVQHANRKTLPGKGRREVTLCEKTQTEGCSSVTGDLEKLRCQQSGLDNCRLSSVSISAIDCSDQHSAAAKHKHGKFETSTPEVPSRDGRAERTASRVKLTGKSDTLDICGNSLNGEQSVSTTFDAEFAIAQATVVGEKDSVRLNDSREKRAEDDRANRQGKGQTPVISVVEQNSLYVTPVMKRRSMRQTFQLVTPLTQHTQSDSSHCATHKSSFRQKTPVCYTHISSRGERRQPHGNEAGDSFPKQHSLQEHQSTEHCVSQRKQKTGDSFLDDSDSDLEIIDASIHDAPSPKFGSQSGLSSSQSQSACRTLTLASPKEQSQPSPKKTGCQTGNRLPDRERTHHEGDLERDSSPRVSQPSPQKTGCQARTQCPVRERSGCQALTQCPVREKSGCHARTQCPVSERSGPPAPEGGLERSSRRGVTPSPGKVSPRRSLKGVSQRSADSDRELLMVTELMCQEAEDVMVTELKCPEAEDVMVTELKCPEAEDVMVTELMCQEAEDVMVTELKCPEAEDVREEKEDASPSGHGTDTVDANRSTDDIWEDFDNLEDYNPDLYLDMETDTHNTVLDRKKTRSPDHSPKSASKSPSKMASNTDPPKKSKIPAKNCAEKEPIPSASRVRSHEKPSDMRTTHKGPATPVKLRPTVSHITPTSKRSCDKLKGRRASETEEIRGEGHPPSPGLLLGEGDRFLLGEGDGFLLASEDTEAANCSFLWWEENAPSEDGAVVAEGEGCERAALGEGPEETALTQQSERHLTHTPVQPKEARQRGKSAIMPSPFTPMPAYGHMSTPQLKNEVQKFGLKPVGKKRMKLVLEDIYHQTHQYETDSDNEEDGPHLPSLDPPVLTKETNMLPPPTLRQSGQSMPKLAAHRDGPPSLMDTPAKKGPSRTAVQRRRPGAETTQTVGRPGAQTTQTVGRPGAGTTQTVGRPGAETTQTVRRPGVQTTQTVGRPGAQTTQTVGRPGAETTQTVGRPVRGGESATERGESGPGKPGKRPKTKRGLAQRVPEPQETQSTSRCPPHQSQESRARLELGQAATPSSGKSPSKGGGEGVTQRKASPCRTGASGKSPSKGGGEGVTQRKASPCKAGASSSSSPEKGSSFSQDSDASELPDVSVFEEERLDSDDNEEITLSQQSAKDLPQKLTSFIRGHLGWHHKILTYEPLDLGVLKEELNAAGIKCSQDKLLDFLDEKCITFTTKNMIPSKRRNRGKKPQSKRVAASQK